MYQICFSVSTVIPAFVLHYLFIEVQYCAKVLQRCDTHSPAFEPICLVIFCFTAYSNVSFNPKHAQVCTNNLMSGDGDPGVALSAAANCLNGDHRVKSLALFSFLSIQN